MRNMRTRIRLEEAATNAPAMPKRAIKQPEPPEEDVAGSLDDE
jgi:hypothetical protein